MQFFKEDLRIKSFFLVANMLHPSGLVGCGMGLLTSYLKIDTIPCFCSDGVLRHNEKASKPICIICSSLILGCDFALIESVS